MTTPAEEIAWLWSVLCQAPAAAPFVLFRDTTSGRFVQISTLRGRILVDCPQLEKESSEPTILVDAMSAIGETVEELSHEFLSVLCSDSAAEGLLQAVADRLRIDFATCEVTRRADSAAPPPEFRPN